jgi:hypothetical protein
MKSSDACAGGFDCRSEKAGEVALVKMLMMDMENTAQNMNLQRNARTGMLVVDGTAQHPAKLVGFKERLEKEWQRRGESAC